MRSSDALQIHRESIRNIALRHRVSATGALLVLVYTHREPDIYRLISSWKANKPQRNMYEKNRR